MGYKLYREVRDRAPQDWTPTERLVALMIADDANDETRKSWIKLPELMARTGVRTESGIRQALQRLAKRGFEFRVPITSGKDGRPVFAVKGRSLDFIVPVMPERRLPAVAFPKATVMDGKATVADAKGDCAESPLSSAPPPQTSTQKMAQERASRRAHASSASANWTVDRVVRDVREGLALVHGDREVQDLDDSQVLGFFFTYVKGARPRNLVAYVSKIVGDGPYLDTFMVNVSPFCDGCMQWESNCACASTKAA